MRIISGETGIFGHLRRLVGTLFLIGLLLAIAGVITCRTRGARDLFESRISHRTGLPVSIGSARIVWPYDLMLENITTKDTEATRDGNPAFSATRLRIGWRLSTVKLFLDQPVLQLRNDEQGCWQPTFFSPLGNLIGAPVAELSRLTAGFRERIHLEIHQGTIRWTDAAGQELSSAEGVFLTMLPLSMPHEQFTYYRLEIATAHSPASRNFRDMRWIWLASSANAYLEIEARSRRRDQDQAGKWQP